jgi:hypothetical protein
MTVVEQVRPPDTKIPELSFEELAAVYCGSNPIHRHTFWDMLVKQNGDLGEKQTGWVLFQNQLMDSNEYGRLRLLAYGPGCSAVRDLAMAERPITFDGLASHTACAIGYMLVTSLDTTRLPVVSRKDAEDSVQSFTPAGTSKHRFAKTSHPPSSLLQDPTSSKGASRGALGQAPLPSATWRR